MPAARGQRLSFRSGLYLIAHAVGVALDDDRFGVVDAAVTFIRTVG
jgi:hypothetical protein